MARYFLLDKPYDVLSQFTREAAHHRTLADVADFPPTVYPVGRLDRDSEGLLLLTDDKRLNAALLQPRHGHQRTYWVQVEGDPPPEALAELGAGVTIRAKGKTHRCAPLSAARLPEEIATDIAPRMPPIRERRQIPTTWLSLTLTEGKNRQVRRMCAAVGYPVLRLLRHAIGGVTLNDLAGERVREVNGDWLLPRLGLRR